MSTPISLDTALDTNGKPVLIAAGEIDLSNIDVFNRELAAQVTMAVSNGKILTLDLSDVQYLDSAAINALYSHAGHIHLIAHPTLMSVLTVSGLTELVTVEVPSPRAAP